MNFDPTGLDLAFWAAMQRVRAALAARGIDMRPSNGLRDPWTQARFYRRSRAYPLVMDEVQRLRGAGAPWCAQCLLDVGPQPAGKWATDAAPGASWHQLGLALDSLAHRPDGSVIESGDDPAYAALAEAAEAEGLTSGLRWSKPDSGHVQAPREPSPLAAGWSWPQIDAHMRQLWEPKRPILAPVPSAMPGQGASMGLDTGATRVTA